MSRVTVIVVQEAGLWTSHKLHQHQQKARGQMRCFGFGFKAKFT
jgi:hypothetical protein